mgnify:CR=1 FL=1
MTKSSMDRAIICFSDLNPKKTHEFDFRPGDDVAGNLVTDLGLLGLSKLRLYGRLFAVGQKGWVLDARLGARVVQSCVVSLDLVSTRIDAAVERKFVPITEMEPTQFSEEDEIEMQQDDSVEPLGAGVDLLSILSESLALELPAYPRSQGAVLEKATFSAEGVVPMSYEDAKPFAGLAALKAKLAK